MLKILVLRKKARYVIAGKPCLKEKSDWDSNILHRIEDDEELVIKVDRNTLQSIHDWEQDLISLKSKLREPFVVRNYTRKSYIPDPELVLTLSKYYFIIYPILKPMLSKIGEKLAEDIADAMYEEAKKRSKTLIHDLRDVITRFNQRVMNPKRKQLLTVFEIPGKPYIEYFAWISSLFNSPRSYSAATERLNHSVYLILPGESFDCFSLIFILLTLIQSTFSRT